MNTTPLESETKDYKELKMSLSQLYDNMLRYYKNDGLHIVIELSRKGPKIMECCPKIEGLSAITEFAIPFLMMTLKKGVTYHIIIVDDAVYYGSTLRNLVKELRDYEFFLGLRFEIIALVALIDKDAPIQTMETTLFGRKGHRSGYGHYFVHHIMSRFRSLHRCMEVEFPIITYEFEKTIDINKVYLALKKKYVQHYINEYPKEGSVITILLQDNKTQFCKFRIYVEEKKMHLAFMSPYNLPHNKESLLHVMDSMGQEYQEIWGKITRLLYDRDLDDKVDDVINRNCERSLVVLANFILSFQFFVKNRQTIEKALSDLETGIKNYDLPKMGLYRLIGNNSLSDELRDILLNNARRNSERSIDINVKEIPYEQQLFEEEYSPSQEERNILVSHNAHMIRNSKSVQEAISAVVFNQDFFMDRWTRHGLYYGPNRHLWFGYTHDTLDILIRRNARRFSFTDTLLMDLHKCIDRRIDQGCVVPQYIINPETRQWVRVFRPGENEDIVLSHLARYIIHIYNLLDCKLNIGFVPRNILDMVLAIIFKRLGGGLNEQFMFTLDLQDDQLVWLDRDMTFSRNVLDYLNDMYVLEINSEEEVTIAPRISDTEFLNNTTLNSNILDKIDSLISNILRNYSKWNISFNHAESFFNYFLNEDASEDTFKNLITDVSKTLFEVLNQIEQNLHYEGRNAIEYDNQNKLIDCFSRIGQYEVHPYFLDSKEFETSDFHYSFGKDQFIHYQTQFEVMSLIINLMIGAYLLEDIDDIKEYLEDNYVKRLMSTPKLKELNTYITQLWKTGREKDLLGSSQFPVVLSNTLGKIVCKNG